jgi:hypothetical protein
MRHQSFRLLVPVTETGCRINRLLVIQPSDRIELEVVVDGSSIRYTVAASPSGEPLQLVRTNV